MVLYKTNKQMIKVDTVTGKLALALSINEEKWNDKQMVKFELKLKKASKAKDYTKSSYRSASLVVDHVRQWENSNMY